MSIHIIPMDKTEVLFQLNCLQSSILRKIRLHGHCRELFEEQHKLLVVLRRVYRLIEQDENPLPILNSLHQYFHGAPESNHLKGLIRSLTVA